MPIERNSLLGARVLAGRALLGREAEGKEDWELLEVANRVHHEAARNTQDEDALEASRALFEEEAEIWAVENGGDNISIGKEARLEAYKEAWSLALNPPRAAQFKPRSEFEKQFTVTLSREECLRRILSGGGRICAPSYVDEDQAIAQYYKQFHDYIADNLPKLSAAKAIANAEEAGLKRLTMEYRPTRTWAIKDIKVRKLGFADRPYLITQSVIEGDSKLALVTPLPDGKFGFINPSGKFKFLGHDIFQEDGTLDKAAVLKAMDLGLNSSRDRAANADLSCLQDWRNCNPSNFELDVEYLDWEYSIPPTLKELMEERVDKSMRAAIDRWKEENYNPSLTETILGAVVPFYSVIKKAQLDPGYKVSFGDVVWDIVDLGLTLVAVGAAGFKAAWTGIAAAKMVGKGLTGTARASAMLHAFMKGAKKSSLMANAGRELADFVVPVFTTAELLRAGGKGGKLLARKGLQAALRKTDEVLAKVPLPERWKSLLDEPAFTTVEGLASFLAKPGKWNSNAGDFAPLAIANLLQREVVIHRHPAGGGNPLRIYPRSHASGPPVELFYMADHYDAVIKGKRVPVLPDGDCLFRAALASHSQEPHVSQQAINAFRASTAGEVRSHPGDYERFLVASEDAAPSRRCKRMGNNCSSGVRLNDAGVPLDEDPILTEIYDALPQTGRVRYDLTSDGIREVVDNRASLIIHPSLFTTRPDTRMNLGEGFASKNEYIRAIVEYVASGNRDGRITDFSMSRSYSETVRAPGHHLMRIDTTRDRRNFKTIEYILKHEGPRLVREEAISQTTLGRAILNSINEPIDQVFYIEKSIPAKWVETLL